MLSAEKTKSLIDELFALKYNSDNYSKNISTDQELPFKKLEPYLTALRSAKVEDITAALSSEKPRDHTYPFDCVYIKPSSASDLDKLIRAIAASVVYPVELSAQPSFRYNGGQILFSGNIATLTSQAYSLSYAFNHRAYFDLRTLFNEEEETKKLFYPIQDLASREFNEPISTFYHVSGEIKASKLRGILLNKPTISFIYAGRGPNISKSEERAKYIKFHQSLLTLALTDSLKNN